MKDTPKQKVTEAEESLEVDDSDDIFDTPSLLWLQMKKTFLKKTRDYQFWRRQANGDSHGLLPQVLLAVLALDG